MFSLSLALGMELRTAFLLFLKLANVLSGISCALTHDSADNDMFPCTLSIP